MLGSPTRLEVPSGEASNGKLSPYWDDLEDRGSVRMRFLDAKYFIGVAILGLALSLSLEAQAQSIGEAAASKIFYNTMGGQTVLVGVSSDLGQSPEAIVINDRKLLKKQEVWALQPLIPPDGLVRVEDGPPVGRNIRERSGSSIGYTESILVDPATGLVHYLIGSGGKIGSGRYIPVPVSAIDLDDMEVWASHSDFKRLDWYSSSQLNKRYPPQPINKEIRAVESALVPTTAVAKLTGGGGLGDADQFMLTQTGDQIGHAVVGSQGQTVGNVSLLVVNRATGQPHQAVVAVPFFGQDAHVLLPLSELTSDAGKLVTSHTPEQLFQKPRYSQGDLVNHFGAVAGG